MTLISGLVSQEEGANLAKLGLAILTIGYNIIFMFQKLVLYRNPKKSELEISLEKKALLSE